MTDLTADTVTEIADLARGDADRHPEPYDLSEDTTLATITLRHNEQVKVLELEKYLPAPHETRGVARLHDPDDFTAYVNRLTNEATTTVWASIDTGQITAVINDHANARVAGWRDHTVTLFLQDDEDWQRWHARDGKPTNQLSFGEFIEDMAHTVMQPDAATMLEVATTMTAKRNLDFKQGTRLDTGDVQLMYEETTTAQAGRKGGIEIPSKIVVRLAPWLGVEPMDIDARLRWRIADGQLVIGYQLLRSDLAKRDVFDRLIEHLRGQLTAPVFLGSPPGALR